MDFGTLVYFTRIIMKAVVQFIYGKGSKKKNIRLTNNTFRVISDMTK